MSIAHFGTINVAEIPVFIQLENVSCLATAVTPAIAEATINARSIGDVTCRINGAVNIHHDWIEPKFEAPGDPIYQIMRGASAPFDLDTNPGYGPLAGVWQDVGVNAFWGFQSPTTPSTSSFTATFTVSIRQTGGPVLDTATWTIQINRVAGGGGGGGGCFTGNMRVLMADGAEKCIADIMAGHEVMSLDMTTNKLVSARVEDVMVPRVCNIYEIKLNNGKTIETTLEHPFRTVHGKWAAIDPNATYTARSGVTARTEADTQLREGMVLYGAESNARVAKIVDTGRMETVYHLARVEPHHNFFVEGMCVHNIFDEIK